VFTISYHGGDGNDVVLTAVSVIRSWTGSASNLWSNPANWSPAGIPSAGEALMFPAGTGAMTNDLPAGTVVGLMTFNNGGTLGGNALTLTGDVKFVGNSYFTCNADLKIGAPLTLFGALSNTYNGAIDVNGQTLTIQTYNTVWWWRGMERSAELWADRSMSEDRFRMRTWRRKGRTLWS
jgi:hypothetical protein